MKGIKFAALILITFSLYTFAQPPALDYDPDTIIVKFRPGLPPSEQQTLVRDKNCDLQCPHPHSPFTTVIIPGHSTPAETLAAFAADPAVEYAELNYICTALLVPNDPFYAFQWHYVANPNWGHINIESAWDITTGDPNVIIAVLDSGIAYETFGPYVQAPDLAQTAFVPGYDFVNNDTHPNDDNNHGTHVAGTVAQSTDNALGVAGVAWTCSVMPVKVLNTFGTGTHAQIADGIYFAVDNGAAVINLSLGGPAGSVTLENALAYAYQNGVTVVCAAGNSFTEGNPVIYPAAYDSYCIAVGATRIDKQRAYYSSTGFWVDIAAPGGDVSLDLDGDGYGDGVLQQTFGLEVDDFSYWFFQGTSMAAPHVAGVAALLHSVGITDPDDIRLALESTAEDLGTPGRDNLFGHGLLNAHAALNYFPVPGDLTADRIVELIDLLLFFQYWLGPTPSPADFNTDNAVDEIDFALLAQNWNN